MFPKKGQKITETPKDTTVRARMDSETINKLDYLVKLHGSDRSKIIRKGIEIQYDSATKE